MKLSKTILISTRADFKVKQVKTCYESDVHNNDRNLLLTLEMHISSSTQSTNMNLSFMESLINCLKYS
jgi:hypothetical protein